MAVEIVSAKLEFLERRSAAGCFEDHLKLEQGCDFETNMRPAALRAHVAEFVLRAGPDATQVDPPLDAVKLLGGLLSCVGGPCHDAGVVERHVQTAELSNGSVYHGGHLFFV